MTMMPTWKQEKLTMIKPKRYTITILCMLAFLSQSVTVLADNKRSIVASTKPLAIIAKSAVADAATVEYLIPANQSPHDFALPMSALQKIAKADVVIWIGNDFETSSAKIMTKVAKTKLITALELADYPLLQSHSNAQHDESDHHMTRDPHVWLSPQNGNQIAFEIQRRLDLPVREIITQQQINKLSSEIAMARSSSYISHHDAYGHFVEAFALKSGLSIRDARGGAQGLKTQYQLRKTITEANVRCILVEPHYGTKDVDLIAEEFNLPMIDFDTQGLSQRISDTAYLEFISALVTQFKICAQ